MSKFVRLKDKKIIVSYTQENMTVYPNVALTNAKFDWKSKNISLDLTKKLAVELVGKFELNSQEHVEYAIHAIVNGKYSDLHFYDETSIYICNLSDRTKNRVEHIKCFIENFINYCE